MRTPDVRQRLHQAGSGPHGRQRRPDQIPQPHRLFLQEGQHKPPEERPEGTARQGALRHRRARVAGSEDGQESLLHRSYGAQAREQK